MLRKRPRDVNAYTHGNVCANLTYIQLRGWFIIVGKVSRLVKTITVLQTAADRNADGLLLSERTTIRLPESAPSSYRIGKGRRFKYTKARLKPKCLIHGLFLEIKH